MSEPKGFFTYFHHEAVLNTLSDAEAGRLYKALLHYGSTGELPDYSGEAALNVAFTLFRTEIDYNFIRYREICEKRSEAGKKSAQARKDKRTDAADPVQRKPHADPQNDPNAHLHTDSAHRFRTMTAKELMEMRFD